MELTINHTMEARDGEKSRQAGAQIAKWLVAAWNGLAYNALAGVCFCSGRTRPCSGAASVASEMTSFTSQWRMRAHPARGVQSCRGRQCPRDDRRPCFSHRVSSTRGVTTLRYHQRINDDTSRQWELTTHQLSVSAPHPKFLPTPKSRTGVQFVFLFFY